MQVKKTVAGSGKAEKIEVQEAIRDLLELESIPRPDDAADALSLALTHWQHLEGTGETPKSKARARS
ncbi:Crossover junction endodeoxyribonuclease RuvC [compost metagenome]